MNIRVEQAGACRKEVHIEVPAADVATEFNAVLTAYAQGVRIPGFRPGKAPKDLVRRRFSKEIAQEVKDRLIPRAYQEALKREKLEAVAVLDVRDKAVEEGQPFAFSLVLDVAPEFSLPDYKGLALQATKREVSDKDIDDTLVTLREQNAAYEEIKGRAVAQGDLVQIDYEGVCDGQPVEQIAPQAAGLGKGQNFWMVADPERAFLPGFGEAMVGANVGEKRQVLVDFPADFAEKAVAGKKATYFADVKEIREKKLPPIDEAFLKSVGCATEAELRDRIRKDMAGLRESNEKRRLQGEIIKQLLERTQFEVPASVLQEETQNEVYDMVQQSTHRGVTREDIENKKDELIETATRNASERIKLRFVLRKIAEAEKIAVTEDELSQRVIALAQRYQTTPQKLQAELEKRGSLGRVAEDARAGKTLAFLLDQAKVAWT
ncbi:MAG TPA: trigger factor [Kiritimatiellia bacterium]|jgi:trigger factor